MKRPRINPRAVINCGDEDTAYLAYIAMFRYAFGRMTYMPGVVVEIIKRNAATLTARTLDQLDRELAEEAERYEHVWKDSKDGIESNYGMECDRQTWLAFHLWIKAELAKREGGAK